MDLNVVLNKRFSKPEILRIAEVLAANPQSLKTFIEHFLTVSKSQSVNASMVFYRLYDLDENLLVTFNSQLIMKLHDRHRYIAIERAILRSLQTLPIPDDLIGICADACFDILNKSEGTIACKVFAMPILERIVRSFPELRHELRFSIEHQLPYQSAGFKSRAKKVLAVL